MKTVFAAALALALGTGCALTSKSEALDIRYFTPDPTPVAHAAAAAASGPELRLGRVAAGDNLHEKIAFSDGSHEVGYYDDRRWTERPDLYLRRSLKRALFERRGLKHVIAGEAPTLDVALLAFEEIKTPGRHAVRVTLTLQLADDHAVLLDATRTVERPVDGKKFQSVVAALADALDQASSDAADAVTATLRARHEPGKTETGPRSSG